MIKNWKKTYEWTLPEVKEYFVTPLKNKKLMTYIFHKYLIQSYRKIVLRALPKLVKLDNVEVTPEEINDALRGPIPEAHHHQQKEEVYEEDYETAYRQQAATSNFRGHSPVREVIWWNMLNCVTALWLSLSV